jgi:hypothetical protein
MAMAFKFCLGVVTIVMMALSYFKIKILQQNGSFDEIKKMNDYITKTMFITLGFALLYILLATSTISKMFNDQKSAFDEKSGSFCYTEFEKHIRRNFIINGFVLAFGYLMIIVFYLVFIKKFKSLFENYAN